ncbi:MAG: NUDIX domain-containing protein, partial [Acidimicrobiales bacterium]|nr:NUDIX domain-containing protein [Acidimicrobiales bacterium]
PLSAPSDRAMVPRPASTVALVRDDGRGLTTYLLRRNPALEFAPGATVYPGGAVDDDDHHPRWERYCAGLDDRQACAELAVERGGLAYYVAAARECFEEVGIVLSDGPQLDRSVGLAAACRDGRQVNAGALWYLGRWITPIGAPRRYDTRFFIAVAPEGQEPEPDEDELLHGEWYRPADALAQHEDGRLELILPTMVTLQFLQRFKTTDSLLGAVAHRRGQAPALVERDGGLLRHVDSA